MEIKTSDLDHGFKLLSTPTKLPGLPPRRIKRPKKPGPEAPVPPRRIKPKPKPKRRTKTPPPRRIKRRK
jgi:hypothetical protein